MRGTTEGAFEIYAAARGFSALGRDGRLGCDSREERAVRRAWPTRALFLFPALASDQGRGGGDIILAVCARSHNKKILGETEWIVVTLCGRARGDLRGRRAGNFEEKRGELTAADGMFERVESQDARCA